MKSSARDRASTPHRVDPHLSLETRPRLQKQKRHVVGRGAFDDSGGAEEDRTPDLRIANATLSQLSYRPTRQGPVYARCRCHAKPTNGSKFERRPDGGDRARQQGALPVSISSPTTSQTGSPTPDQCGRSASSLRSWPRPILAVSQLTEAGSMRVQLTKRQVETCQPQEHPHEIRDAQAAFLRVQCDAPRFNWSTRPAHANGAALPVSYSFAPPRRSQRKCASRPVHRQARNASETTRTREHRGTGACTSFRKMAGVAAPAQAQARTAESSDGMSPGLLFAVSPPQATCRQATARLPAPTEQAAPRGKPPGPAAHRPTPGWKR